MQEQVNEKTMSLVIRGGKLTADTLARAMRKFLADMERQKQLGKKPKSYQGKQSVKQLVKQGVGVGNVELSEKANIKGFERVARKYGVDYALKKDTSEEPTKWIIFFKSRDEDAITTAMREFSTKVISKSKGKPSLLATLRKNIELVRNRAVDKVRNKQHEGPEL